MKRKTPITRETAEPAGVRQRLTNLRQALLKLHKALLDSERVAYERTVGKIQSPNHFLQLVISDPWFAWLHPLSQLIVAMDEALDAEEPLRLPGWTAWFSNPNSCSSPPKPARTFPAIITKPCNATRTWCSRTPKW